MIRAVVFDFDGLILDTEGPVFESWQAVFVEHGCPPISMEEWAQEIGTAGWLDIEGILRARATKAVDLDAMHASRRALRDDLLAREVVRPGVIQWLDDADALGWPVAIASSSGIDWIETHLGRLGLRDRFRAVACRGDGRASKPAPDTYLAACKALDVAPNNALAIEDSPHGITAAKAAGLYCVAVPNAITAQLDVTHADVILQSLTDASLSEIAHALSTKH